MTSVLAVAPGAALPNASSLRQQQCRAGLATALLLAAATFAYVLITGGGSASSVLRLHAGVVSRGRVVSCDAASQPENVAAHAAAVGDDAVQRVAPVEDVVQRVAPVEDVVQRVAPVTDTATAVVRHFARGRDCVLQRLDSIYAEVRAARSAAGGISVESAPVPAVFTVPPMPAGPFERTLALPIPIHPPHFKYTVDIVRNRYELGVHADWDVFFVYMNEADARAHAAYLAVHANLQHLSVLLTPQLVAGEWMGSASIGKLQIVNNKKHFAAAVLCGCYEMLLFADVRL